jgi:hypothetical protein
MRIVRATPLLLFFVGFITGCGGSSPSSPSPPPTVTPPPATPSYKITTLITVYRTSISGAFWSRGTTTDERLGEIILGVNDLASSVGSTNLNNEGGRLSLQEAIDRIRDEFRTADYQEAFGETEGKLERYLNDADNDTWSIDGRNGVGRDWPYDNNGNDPDGWTGQIVVTVERN